MRSPTRGRRPGRSAAVLSLLFAAASVIAACAASGSASTGAGAAAATAAPADGASVGGGDSVGGAGVGAPAASAGTGSGGTTGDDPIGIIDDQKIVRTGSLQLTVTDVTKSLTSARDAIRSFGGYIGGSQQQRDGDSIVAIVTYRIPVARWEDALDALRGLGTEIGERTDAVEVTGDVVDLQARIVNLKASEAALVGYAEKAPQVSDLLQIQARLTDTRSQIEQLTAQEQQLQGQASYATLTVTFGTEPVAVTEAAAKWDPATEVGSATTTLVGMGQAVLSFLIVFTIVWLPLILAITLVSGIVVWVARRLGLGRPNRMPPLPPVAPTPSAEA
jgi:uncharacterized protein DUF4349